MLSFRLWLEALHAYDDPEDFKTRFQPVRGGDTVRVFHGFNSFDDAFRVANVGVSGRYRADRRYSYESDNNPNGIFVSINFKKTQEFTSPVQDQVVMEFVAKVEDLDAPVWPGGGYTVQGGMAQYFGHGRAGRVKRKARRQQAEKETEDHLKRRRDPLLHVQDSDSKYLANMLLNSTEHQALFVGDLNPGDIAAFWVKPKGSAYNASWERLAPEQFKERYREYKSNVKYPHESTGPAASAFRPGDEFDPETLIRGLGEKVIHSTDRNKVMTGLGSLWRMVDRNKGNRMSTFQNLFRNYLWPKQYKNAFLWLKNTFGKGGHGE